MASSGSWDDVIGPDSTPEPTSTRTHQRSHSYNSNSFSARSLLPKHMVTIIEEEEEEVDLTIDAIFNAYDENLENKELKEASRILNNLLLQTRDPKERSKFLRRAANSNKKYFYHNEACQMYEEAEKADPGSTQNYIDHAKLLDEIGQITEAEEILQ